MSIACTYLRWTEKDIAGLARFDGYAQLLTELDASGQVLREIGLSPSGTVIHKFPSTSFRHGARGLFDVNTIRSTNLRSEVSASEFEQLWNSSG